MTLSIRSVPSDKQTIVRLALDGQLDAVGAPDLETSVGNVVTPEIKILILDLCAMSFVSSAGLRIFAKVRNLMKQRTGVLLLVNPQPQVIKVFKIVKAVQLSEIYTSDAELDAYLTNVQQGIDD